MDKKKLIGTIIGVTLFAILIAGATYAFLTFAANVTGGTYNGKTLNFLVDYTKGTDVRNVKQLTTATPGAIEPLVVQAAKHAGSPDGNLTIQLNTATETDDVLLTGEVLNYAVCKGAACVTDFSAAKTGVVTSKTQPAILVENEPLSTEAVSYYIYFWLDASKITNDHFEKSYSGNISASATQVE